MSPAVFQPARLRQAMTRRLPMNCVFLACVHLCTSHAVMAQAPPQKKNDTQSTVKAESTKASASNSSEEITRLVQSLVTAIRGNDSDAVTALISLDGLFAEVERQGILTSITTGERTSLRTAMALSVGNGLLDEAAKGKWKAARIHGTSLNPKGPTPIALHLLDKNDQQVAVVKFWLTRDRQSWKIIDWQDSNSIFRTSTMIAVTVASFRLDPGAEVFQQLVSAARQAVEGHFAEVEETLEPISDYQLPDELEAARCVLQAQVAYQHGMPESAIEHLELAAKHDPEFLPIRKMQASVYAALGDYARSLESAEQALKALGDDAEVYSLIGDAQARLGQREKAVVSYQKGLDADSHSIPNLMGLAAALPKEKKDALIARIDRLSDRNALFTIIADGLVNTANQEALRLLLDAAQKWSIDESMRQFYLGEASVLDSKLPEATEHFKTAIAQAKSEDTKHYYTGRLLYSYLNDHRPAEGYRACEDAAYAFNFLVSELYRIDDTDGLMAVAQAHIERMPDDVSGYFYAGQAQLMREHFDLADKVLEAGSKLTMSADLRGKFRSSRVEALFKLGKAIEAYQQVGPQRATFDQLVRLLVASGQAEPLLKIVSLQRKVEPDDPSLVVWEAEAHLLTKDYPQAITILQTATNQAMSPTLKSLLAGRLLAVQLAANRPVEAYLGSIDRDQAFGVVCEYLLKKEDATGLLAVAAEHEKKTPDDLRINFYRGKAYVLNRDFKAAESEFANGIEHSTNPTATEHLSRERILARCQLGQAVDAYRESNDKLTTFDTIVPVLVANKRADDLEAVVKAHREEFPRFPTLGFWEAEANWLRSDYQKTATILSQQKDSLALEEGFADRVADRLVRSLVRLKKFDEALTVAQESTKEDGDPWFEAIVAVCRGDMKQAEAILAKCIELGYAIEDLETDEDIGPVLKSEAFDSVRKKLTAAR